MSDHVVRPCVCNIWNIQYNTIKFNNTTNYSLRIDHRVESAHAQHSLNNIIIKDSVFFKRGSVKHWLKDADFFQLCETDKSCSDWSGVQQLFTQLLYTICFVRMSTMPWRPWHASQHWAVKKREIYKGVRVN